MVYLEVIFQLTFAEIHCVSGTGPVVITVVNQTNEGWGNRPFVWGNFTVLFLYPEKCFKMSRTILENTFLVYRSLIIVNYNDKI